MPALRDMQREMAALIVGSAAVSDAPPPAYGELVRPARIALHARNYRATLTAALGDGFPRTARTVGEGFFAYAAAQFIARTPPRDPVIASYGAEFADFLAGFAPAAALPYLADLARLEWTIGCAARAPRGPAIAAADLARVPRDRAARLLFRPAPHAALFQSEHAVDAVWRFAGRDGDADEALDLAALPPARLLIAAGGDAVHWHPLAAPAFAFIAALFAGRNLADAAVAAIALDPAFQPGAALAGAIAAGAFASMEVAT